MMKKIVPLIIVAALVLGVFLFVKTGALQDMMLGKEKVEDNTKWVYNDFTYDYDGTEAASIRMANATAKDVANGYVSEIVNPEALFDEDAEPKTFTYYDYIICKEGKVYLHQYTRIVQESVSTTYYTAVTESETEIGTYDGKDITLTDTDTYGRAYVSEGVLYVTVNPLTNLEMTVELQFKLSEQ